jgi:hypothetical protein
VRPQPDDYPKHVKRAVRAFVEAGWEAGATALEPVAFSPAAVAARRTPPRAARAQVFVRDRFICRYCGGKTIFEPVMALLGFVYPQLFPYHPNWRGGVTHPALTREAPLSTMSSRDRAEAPGSSSTTSSVQPVQLDQVGFLPTATWLDAPADQAHELGRPCRALSLAVGSVWTTRFEVPPCLDAGPWLRARGCVTIVSARNCAVTASPRLRRTPQPLRVRPLSLGSRMLPRRCKPLRPGAMAPEPADATHTTDLISRSVIIRRW